MKQRLANEAAKAGFYFNTRTWELHLHRTDGEALPGQEGDRFFRIPAATLLVLGPMMGFLFVIFLPFIGFALTFRELAHRAKGLVARRAQARDAAKPARP